MFLKQILLSFLGFSAGIIIAAGIFAFLAIIGIFPRLIDVTRMKNHIVLCETMMIIGGILGNLMDLFRIPKFSQWFGFSIGTAVLGIFGSATGIFVGCLVMSLAETVKALPILSRRIHLANGLQYVIASVAVGKSLGSIIYFIYDFGK